MILQFSNKIKDKETKFAEKILKGFSCLENKYYDAILDFRDFNVVYDKKIHTIRNTSNRWKVGTKIHFKEWSGRPYNSKNIEIAPQSNVRLIQNIKIEEYLMTRSDISYQMPDSTIYGITIDGIRQTKKQIHEIVINDGFENEIDFFSYFKRFEGIIIHWTDLKY